MEIKIGDPFEHDEHTSADGALVRILKARRSLVIAAVVAALHSHATISYPALSSVMGGVLSLSNEFARSALFLTLLVLTGQYFLIFTQFWASLRVSVQERLSARSAHKIERIRTDLHASEAELKAVSKAVSGDETRANELANHVFALQAEVDELGRETAPPSIGTPAKVVKLSKAHSHLASVKAQKADLESGVEARKGELAALRQRYVDEQATLALLVRDTPEFGRWFRLSEYLFDVSRAVVPLAVSLYALSQLAMLIPSNWWRVD